MSLPELLSQKKSLEATQNDPFPDDDQAGDIAVGLWLDRVNNKIAIMNLEIYSKQQ